MPSPEAPLVAIVDSSEQVVELIAELLDDEGYRTVTLFPAADVGPLAVADFLSAHRPDACVYSLSVPYGESWAAFQALRRHVPDCPFVLTATSIAMLQRLVGVNGIETGLELIGKPFALQSLADAVRRALGRPVPGAVPPA